MNKKILIIEDEKAMVKVLEAKLTSAGFEVKSAFDGEQALEVLGQEKFDLLLLDVIMPKMDGFQLLSQLKSKGISCPCIVLSNLAQEEDVKKAKELGCLDYLVKSDTPLAKLVEYIQRVLS